MSDEQQQNNVKSKAEASSDRIHELEITYKIDGEVIKVIRRDIDEKYRWFLLGNSSWRES